MSVNIDTATGRRTVVIEPEWFPRPDGLERAVVFQPGYNGDRNYGVHGMEITWYLRGPKGCVYITVSVSSWIPGQLGPGHGLAPAGYPSRAPEQHPHGFGMRSCTPVPQYEGQSPSQDDCPLIGAPCYADTWFGGADEPAREFTEHGESVMWAALEERYADLGVPS